MVGVITQQPPESKTPQENQITERGAEDKAKEAVEEGAVTKYATDEVFPSTKYHTRHG